MVDEIKKHCDVIGRLIQRQGAEEAERRGKTLPNHRVIGRMKTLGKEGESQDTSDPLTKHEKVLEGSSCSEAPTQHHGEAQGTHTPVIREFHRRPGPHLLPDHFQ